MKVSEIIQKTCIVLISLYLIMVGWFVVMQRSLMYPEFVSMLTLEVDETLGMRNIEITTIDGLLLRAKYREPEEGRETFLVFHGNGGTISNLNLHAEGLIAMGYGVLLAEYRYFGGNPGKPSEQGFYKDSRAYYEWLKNQNVDDIVIYGRSLGSGVAVQLATEVDAKAVVLEVPFSSAVDVAAERYPFIPFPSLLMLDQFRSDEKIGSIRQPILVGLATQDTEVPIDLGKQLFSRASEPKKLVIYDGANHENLPKFGFLKDVHNFLEKTNSTKTQQSDNSNR